MLASHSYSRSARPIIGLGAALLCASAAVAETPAGTAIVNVAQLNYAVAGQPATLASNENRIIVAERLDVALTAGPVAPAADASIAVPAILTNQGNGQEAFAIAATASAGAAQLVRLALDGDGDGRYDPAHDPELSGGRTPVLGPGQTVTIFAILSAGTTGTVTIGAAAATGAGTPGTGFPGAGDAGGDAVTGPTGAQASVTVPLAAASGIAPTLTKSASVMAPDGSTRAVRGAAITYTLIASFPAATQAAQIADPLPAGTSYAPASLTLDGAALSDAADGDTGDATPARIAVRLSDQPAGAVRTIRFKVIIQ